MDKTFNIRLQVRTDTEAAFTTANPVLLLNELIFVTEVGETKETKMKLGDGTKTFSELPYIEMGGGSSGEIEFPVTSVNGQTGDVTLSASDVSALPSSTTYVSSINGSSGAVTISSGNEIKLSST